MRILVLGFMGVSLASRRQTLYLVLVKRCYHLLELLLG